LKYSLAGALALTGLLAVAFSFVAADERDGLRELAQNVRPARATLVSTELKEISAARNVWDAVGTFDVESGDHKGRATGSLEPAAHRAKRRRTDRQPKETAQSFAASWQVGRTYDAFWNPDRPNAVFFSAVDPAPTARLVVGLRVAAAVLVAAGLLLWRRGHR
jgi:hypothetical protein